MLSTGLSCCTSSDTPRPGENVERNRPATRTQTSAGPPFLSAPDATPFPPLLQALAPGSLSLNLHGVPAESAIGFHAAVAELVPKCVRLPVTTESLSAKFKFAPKKVHMSRVLSKFPHKIGYCCSTSHVPK